MHCIYAAFQKLCLAKQDLNSTFTSLSTVIVTTFEHIDVSDYNKHLFFCTR